MFPKRNLLVTYLYLFAIAFSFSFFKIIVNLIELVIL